MENVPSISSNGIAVLISIAQYLKSQDRLFSICNPKDLVLKIIKENPKPVEDYKKGKEQAVMFLIGKAMAALKGRGNPEVLKKMFISNL